MPQTLLLADDSVTIQRVIELTFADEDIRVLAVSDGDQAIERIDAEPPDIVLVDVGMPGRSGYEVARHIKDSPRLQHIPVLLLTGAFEPVDDTKAAAAGCDGVLAKPFEPALVIARVKELLAGSAPADRSDRATLDAPASPVEAARPSQIARLDSYFAQLDEAFSTLGETLPAQPTPFAAAPEAPAPGGPTGPGAGDPMDWFGTTPDAPAIPLPDLAMTPPEPPSEPPSTWTAATSELSGVSWAQEEPAPPASHPLPPLSDAFAAMLDAEQHEPLPLVAPTWPTSAPSMSAGNGHGALTDQAVEDITRRVLERMSDRVVRETVADLVSEVAERLVRGEIARIKASIQ